jgi:hypothetical protein
MTKIAVICLAIGEDYRKSLSKCLDSKREYCLKHGYDYFEFHEECWNRDRPIAWSKVPVWKDFCKKNEYDYIWISDADVYITNMDIKLEDHILPLLPANKDLLITFDSCGHVNTGNMIVKPSAWSINFFQKVWDQTDCLYHIWWENAAVTKLLGTCPEDVEHVVITDKAYLFNAYIQGLPNMRLWLPGDFLVHFAGVYDPDEMNVLIAEIDAGRIPRRDMWHGQRLDDAST